MNAFWKYAELIVRLDKEQGELSQDEVIPFSFGELSNKEIQKLPSAKNVDVKMLRQMLNLFDAISEELNHGEDFLSLRENERPEVIRFAAAFGDAKKFENYSDIVSDWYGGGIIQKSPKRATKIIQYAPALKLAFPHEKIPEKLYRGLSWDKRRPKAQRFFYLSRPPRLLSGWTSDYDVAEGFGDDLVLTVRKKDVLSCATPVLWPGTPFSDAFRSEREWVLYIKKPMLVEVRWFVDV